MEQLIISLLSGAAGGNIVGKLLKNLDLGPLGNSIAGIIGGGLGSHCQERLGQTVQRLTGLEHSVGELPTLCPKVAPGDGQGVRLEGGHPVLLRLRVGGEGIRGAAEDELQVIGVMNQKRLVLGDPNIERTRAVGLDQTFDQPVAQIVGTHGGSHLGRQLPLVEQPLKDVGNADPGGEPDAFQCRCVREIASHGRFSPRACRRERYRPAGRYGSACRAPARPASATARRSGRHPPAPAPAPGSGA